MLAVVAGHMHRQLRGSGPARERPGFLRDEEGTLFINAARVPRVFKHPETKAELRHHVILRIEGERAEAEDVLVPG